MKAHLLQYATVFKVALGFGVGASAGALGDALIVWQAAQAEGKHMAIDFHQLAISAAVTGAISTIAHLVKSPIAAVNCANCKSQISSTPTP